jgi:hypothetical protein
MQTFPESWLHIIAKHLRRHMNVAAEAPLPADIWQTLEKLRMSEIARLNRQPA